MDPNNTCIWLHFESQVHSLNICSVLVILQNYWIFFPTNPLEIGTIRQHMTKIEKNSKKSKSLYELSVYAS